MAFHYYSAANLSALFSELYSLRKAERIRLPPQTPQTIVVGSLDTEAYVRREYLARDGILMGVNFPFLESAIENFSARIFSDSEPGANENWFTPPVGGTAPMRASALELEVAALSLILDKANSGLLSDLGFPVEKQNSALQVLWARKIAARIGEYLLHLPDTMAGFSGKKTKGLPAIAIVWQKIQKSLAQKNFQSTLIDPASLTKNISQAPSPGASLYLFGMPILSAYHARVLAAISRKTHVHLFTLDLSPADDTDDRHLRLIRNKFSAYRKVLHTAAAEANAEFSEKNFSSREQKGTKIEIWAFPGKWRAAEILSDHWSHVLRYNPELYQDDIAAMLSDLADSQSAFERAATARDLTVHSLAARHLTERPHAHAGLMTTLLKINSAGLSRALLAEYLTNAVVRQAAGLDAVKTELFTRAVERADAYRDDYTDSLAVFNFSDGLRRILRGNFAAPQAGANPDAPPAVWLREFENHETLGDFFQTIWYPLQGARELSGKKGPELFAALAVFMEHTGFSATEGYRDFLSLVQRVQAASADFALDFSQLCRILSHHLKGTSIAESSSKEGISLSPLTGAQDRKYISFFDLNEHLDTAISPGDPWLPEFDAAPTVLKDNEQTHIALETALAAYPTELILGYSEFSPATGSEEYPSQTLSFFIASLARRGISTVPQRRFPMTILELPAADTPVLAANGDIRTLHLLLERKSATSLGDLLRPQLPEASATQVEIRELMRYLTRPTVAKLGSVVTGDSDIVDFSREEPTIALSEKNRLRFCETYLKTALWQTAAEVAPPLEVLAGLERRGKNPPEGFDRMRSLLNREGNAETLFELAVESRRNLRIVEYILHPDIENAFSAEENDRLLRRYLPAPAFAGLKITGTLGQFLQSKGSPRLEVWQSAIYPERSAALVTLHLQLILLAAAGEIQAGDGIDITEHKFSLKKGSEVLSAKKSVSAHIESVQVARASEYVTALVQSFQAAPLIWFDLDFIKPASKLLNAADLDEAEFHEQMQADPKSRNAREADFLRRYFALESDAAGFAFFDRFIRPVALIDTETA